MCICKRNTCYPSIQISFLYVACVSGPLKPSSRNSHFFIWRFEHIPSRKSPFLWLQTISKCWVYGLLGYPHRTHEDISVSGTQTRRIAGNFRENTLEIMKHVELIDSRNFVSVSNQEAFQFMDVVLHGQFQVLQVILLLVTEAVTPRNLCPQLTTPQKPRNFPFPCKTSTFGLSQLSLLDFHGFYPPSWGLALHPITLKRASKISPLVKWQATSGCVTRAKSLLIRLAYWWAMTTYLLSGRCLSSVNSSAAMMVGWGLVHVHFCDTSPNVGILKNANMIYLKVV